MISLCNYCILTLSHSFPYLHIGLFPSTSQLSPIIWSVPAGEGEDTCSIMHLDKSAVFRSKCFLSILESDIYACNFGGPPRRFPKEYSHLLISLLSTIIILPWQWPHISLIILKLPNLKLTSDFVLPWWLMTLGTFSSHSKTLIWWHDSFFYLEVCPHTPGIFHKFPSLQKKTCTGKTLSIQLTSKLQMQPRSAYG